MSDLECPYCGYEQDLDYEGGYGTAEDKLYEHQCESCEKNFVFTTGIILTHTSLTADCLNGGQHKMKPVVHAPKIFPDWVRCEDCNQEIRGDMSREYR